MFGSVTKTLNTTAKDKMKNKGIQSFELRLKYDPNPVSELHTDCRESQTD